MLLGKSVWQPFFCDIINIGGGLLNKKNELTWYSRCWFCKVNVHLKGKFTFKKNKTNVHLFVGKKCAFILFFYWKPVKHCSHYQQIAGAMQDSCRLSVLAVCSYLVRAGSYTLTGSINELPRQRPGSSLRPTSRQPQRLQDAQRMHRTLRMNDAVRWADPCTAVSFLNFDSNIFLVKWTCTMQMEHSQVTSIYSFSK